MAGYGANYTSDFGKVYRSVRLSSRLYRQDGSVTQTKSSFDLPYLPAVYLGAVEPNAKRLCSLIFTPRAVKLYRDEGDYLYLQHPFQPTTAEYQTFMIQLQSNPNILQVERVGEKLSDLYTDLLTK
ncbi:MAG: hypothetical protein AAF652_13755 [Cyanobacteria bacterium P01_C01_bin.72]